MARSAMALLVLLALAVAAPAGASASASGAPTAHAASPRGPIPRWIGRRGHVRFFLGSRGFPRSVAPDRFAGLARRSARRWGLRSAYWTFARPGRFDRYNVVGFGRDLPSRALGLERDVVANLYRRETRCLTRTSGGVVVGRSCVALRPRFVGRRTLDRDIILRSDVPWAVGPQRPDADQFDLESVLLHELGHMAGNHRHRPRCANSPLVEALGRGEWWHGPHDWFQTRCGRRVRAAGAGAGAGVAPLALVRRVVHARPIVLPARP